VKSASKIGRVPVSWQFDHTVFYRRFPRTHSTLGLGIYPSHRLEVVESVVVVSASSGSSLSLVELTTLQ